MDFQVVADLIMNQGIWAIMFVWLFWNTREESKLREEKLMNVIEEHGNQLSHITETLQTINAKIDKFHGKDAE